RAVEVANLARLPDLAIEAAKTWLDIEPSSPQALQVTAALLIGSKRVEEAEPYLERLLAADGVNLENGFMQLSRLLAGNPDKSANLRVVRQLAAKHPKLAPAQFAIAQAALVAGDDDRALAPGRRGEHEAAARPGLSRRERRALPAGPDRRGAEGLAARHRMVRADRQRRAGGPRAPARRERDRQAGKARRGARLPEARGRGQPRPGSAAGRGRGAAAARGEPQPRRLRAARPGAAEGSRAARPALRHGADRREAGAR